MSRQVTFSNTIHLRDFVDSITDDPSRENAPNYVEIQADVNIFEEDGFYTSSIDIEPIRTRIHAYLTREERDLYTPNTFFYADGRFSATQSVGGTLEISVQALSLSRHPGDVSDFEEYRRYLPGQWLPIVTVIGSVPSPNDNTSDPSEPRRFTVETSVYDASKASPVPLSVACFFENTKRWQKVRTPSPGALLSITAKVAGRTTDTNHLALRVLDLAYLPRPAQVPPATPTPTATPPSKRSARWEGRATPSTPSKRQRVSEGASDVAEPSYGNPTSQEATGGRLHLPHLADNALPNPPSPLIIADAEESSITLAPSPSPDGGTRPHRSRHPPKKYADRE
ncbi:hypothetical protein EDB81DRAFT_766815 [Dactylonectria macrodidyma]|uniref:Uncharacterized protein n=1 Tax=Dactylonectria macrodidyma TaxID=307937 RepID=A0A9P9DID3_9HYPO|nr:hypothetical protein EDB81DRAFT_766815 [Dactylonectria macrodidyma]